ncbi:MAG TPA: diacylglycerol kinase family protein [Symbiobacteriaceae bacterium]|jgi:YegS/Rv2252/BmrU family lipid kinase|nr:diacylglycerol kinase family protein [Symbiobacteriaceae bacterium]
MPRLCFIVNPTAGHGRALKTWRRIEPVARTLGEYGVKFTERPRHGEVLARQAAQEGYDVVVALGGDGTLNEVGNGLIGTGAALAVVPTGTGNDWVRTVGIPRDPEVACRIAFTGRRVPMDVGLAVGYRHFFNIAGIGFDAEVSRQVNDYGPVLKAIGGTLPSLLAIVGTLFRFMGATVQVELDGQPRTIDKMLLMAVGIARYYGGGMEILPDAVIDDGQFDVAWGGHLGRAELVSLVGKIYKGGHVGHPKVSFERCARITATAATPVAFHLDGDVAGNLPVTFELLPGALDVIIP